MKKKYFILTLFVILSLFINAQESLLDKQFYYYKGEKIELQIDFSRISVISEGSFDFGNIKNVPAYSIKKEGRSYTRKIVEPLDEVSRVRQNKEIIITEIEFPETLNRTDYFDVIQQISKENNIIKVAPTHTVSGSKDLGISNNFYVKLFKTEDVETLHSVAEQYSIEILGYNKFMPLWFTLSCGKESSLDAIEAANIFYETKLFESSEPELLYHNLLASNPPNDIYFPDQWGLQNTYETSWEYRVDIKTEEAWTITKGDNVVVAVFDHGFEMDHPDLINNVYGTGYDAITDTSPAEIRGSHGTPCAGIIAAEQNNNEEGISGVAPNAKLMSISVNLNTSDTPQQLANGFSWAWNNGADVISNSWGFVSGMGYAPSSILEEAIDSASTYGRNGKGCVVVFAAGNENNMYIRYPANNNNLSDILVVGAIDDFGLRAKGNQYGNNWGSCYGPKLDVMAPGVFISTTDLQGGEGYNNMNKPDGDYLDENYTKKFDKTSAACPHVAGVAALMLSVNPNLTAKQVREIICHTASKLTYYDIYNLFQTYSSHPYGTWNNEVGYGLVDAYKAVKFVQDVYPYNADLYMKDCPNDYGIEYPDPAYPCGVWAVDKSPDIWLRKNPDGYIHQECDPNAYHYEIGGDTIRYVYVRVRNRGEMTNDGSGQISVYWAKTTALSGWPDSWNGNNPEYGDFIGSQNIGFIEPGEEKIFQFQWNVTNNFSDDRWQKCVLARIEDCNDDPIPDFAAEAPSPQLWQVNYHVVRSNNISIRNCQFIVEAKSNVNCRTCGGYIFAGNHTAQAITANWEFKESINIDRQKLIENCQVTLTFDSIGWGFMQEKLMYHESFSIIGREKKVMIISPDAVIENIEYPPYFHFPVLIEFNFYGTNFAENDTFEYSIVEYLSDTTLGPPIKSGIHYNLTRPDINFEARILGRQPTIYYGDPIILNAEDQNIPNLIYKWYEYPNLDSIIGTGLTINYLSQSPSPLIALEVEYPDKCMSSFTRVAVNVISDYITSIYPNPVSGNLLTVDYIIQSSLYAQIRIIDLNGYIIYNTNLDINQTSIDIDVSNYAPGTYIVDLLTCNARICAFYKLSDSKNFIKM